MLKTRALQTRWKFQLIVLSTSILLSGCMPDDSSSDISNETSPVLKSELIKYSDDVEYCWNSICETSFMDNAICKKAVSSGDKIDTKIRNGETISQHEKLSFRSSQLLQSEAYAKSLERSLGESFFRRTVCAKEMKYRGLYFK